MKKKLLIVVNSLNIGGAEKSLVSFLNELDYSKFKVDLQMFNLTGEFLSLLNKNVNILDKLEFMSFCDTSLIKQIISFKFNYLFSRIKLTLELRSNRELHDSQTYWKECSGCFVNVKKKYDIAIGWGQGLPTYYVSEKVIAKQKFAWINVDYEKAGYKKSFDYNFYNKMNNIILVSNDLFKIFSKVYPEFVNKMNVIYDINSYGLISKMSKEPLDTFYKEDLILVTVGRLVSPKGYDLAVGAAKLLKEKQINYKWLFVGEGPERSKIDNLIRQYGLEENVILVGAQSNPYKYMNVADIYVQTSRFEGYCLTLAEARMLNKPIVTTNFDVVYDQMVHKKNGLIVEMNEEKIAETILKLNDDELLRDVLVENLKKEKKGNAEEINKFYEIIKSVI